MTLLEVLVVVSLLVVLVGIVLVTPFRDYARARAASDAAATLAGDLALLERAAQNGGANDGATLVIVSANPLVYECRYGRPNNLDPNSALGPAFIRRSFVDVALAGGPISASTPLLFASNGSAQFVTGGLWSEQHQLIELGLAPAIGGGRAVTVQLDLFTGATSLR